MRIFKSIVTTLLTTFLYGCNDKIVGAFAITILLASLGLVDEDTQEDIYQACEYHPIQSSYDAFFVADRIADTINFEIGQLEPGIYNEEEISCYRGSMTLSGVLNWVSGESCGNGCTRNYKDHDVVATLSNCIYVGDYTSHLYSISGDIVVSDSMGIERYEDGTFIPFGDYTITDNGTEITLKATGDGCDNDVSTSAIEDTIYSLYAYEQAVYKAIHTYWNTVTITGNGGTYTYPDD